jgi:hypothetical protein
MSESDPVDDRVSAICVCCCRSHGVLSDNERATFGSIVRHAYEHSHFRGRVQCARDVVLHVAPNHNMCTDGEVRGFRIRLSDDLCAASFPMSRHMFFGHTGVEIADLDMCGEKYAHIVHGDVSRLRETMAAFLRDVRTESVGKEPTLQCVPSNTVAPLGGSYVVPCVPDGSGYVDSAPWSAELPQRIGFYHAYVRDMENGRRRHKLYAVCSGGCTRAADELFNVHLDVQNTVCVGDFCCSEEMWWLRSCSHRMRRRLLNKFCTAFGVKVDSSIDMYAHRHGRADDKHYLAPSHYNTFDVDMEHVNDNVLVLNDRFHYCVPSSGLGVGGSCVLCNGKRCSELGCVSSVPGRSKRRSFVYYWNHCTTWSPGRDSVLSSMYPADGYRLWRRRGRGMVADGTVGVTDPVVFPTSMFSVSGVGMTPSDGSSARRRQVVATVSRRGDRKVNTVYIQSKSDPRVVEFEASTGSVIALDSATSGGYFQFPNDTYLQVLQEMEWSRDSGYVEMMPLVVGTVV